MYPEMAAEWARLGKLAFRRQEKTGDLFKCASGLLHTCSDHPDIQWLRLIKDWMLVPLTLWPVDFAGLALHVCDRVRSGKRLDSKIIFGLEQLQQLPSEKAQTAISGYEMHVQQGNYEPLILAHSKFETQEKEILNSSKLRTEWNNFKRTFDVAKFRDRKGIIRRRMAQERNFRPDWEFKRKTSKSTFQTAFDGFCHRWQLYGMEGDKPLLLKLSVNPTAHGLMIVIPSYWSLDSKRDLNWQQINDLHKARGTLRQGKKMGEFRVERHLQAQRAVAADKKAKELGLRGQSRVVFIAREIPLPLDTDDRIIRRLVKEGSRL